MVTSFCVWGMVWGVALVSLFLLFLSLDHLINVMAASFSFFVCSLLLGFQDLPFREAQAVSIKELATNIWSFLNPKASKPHLVNALVNVQRWLLVLVKACCCCNFRHDCRMEEEALWWAEQWWTTISYIHLLETSADTTATRGSSVWIRLVQCPDTIGR